uniref:Protein Vpu n=1 Tax=Steinernema glaseri TaxID=37863 RepID=A0A1I7Z1P1_9BILA
MNEVYTLIALICCLTALYFIVSVCLFALFRELIKGRRERHTTSCQSGGLVDMEMNNDQSLQDHSACFNPEVAEAL